MRVPYVKCQGSGNAFIILDLLYVKVRNDLNLQLLALEIFKFAKQDNKVDGVIFIAHSNCADVRILIFNPDGTRTLMCLNGIRCVGKYLFKNDMPKENLRIETDSGVVKLVVNANRDLYRVNDINKISINPLKAQTGQPVFLDDISLKYKFMWVDVYTPYLLTVVDDFINEYELLLIGRECNKRKDLFPFGINVSFIKIINKDALYVRTYERCDIGLSLSCSSSMVAAVCMMVELGEVMPDNKITVFNKGGSISCTCHKNNLTKQLSVDLEGDAVFEHLGAFYVNDDCSIRERKVLSFYSDLKEYKDKLIKIKKQCGETDFLIEI